jgi:peptidoglycan/xylan/chitin deacetylase (PgdA/CDA1 family)
MSEVRVCSPPWQVRQPGQRAGAGARSFSVGHRLGHHSDSHPNYTTIAGEELRADPVGFGASGTRRNVVRDASTRDFDLPAGAV